MKSLQQLLTQDHKDCDLLLAETESVVAKAEIATARANFRRFREAMERHMDAEEQILFPAFEARTGERLGPTEVMRREHQMMRDLLAKMDAALTQQQAKQYLGLSETLLVLMQQHNVKEESVLYPMMDQQLNAEREAVLARLRAAGIG
ncbi:MAG TPA: hemerythrin domain-containing protein [Burkholderiales bacterium]|jgi:hemerythrin-like domain-containing protein